MMTNEGVAAVDEAINYLRICRPCSTLKLSIGMSRAAQDHVDDQGPKGAVGHDGSDGSASDERVSRYGSWLENATSPSDLFVALLRVCL